MYVCIYVEYCASHAIKSPCLKFHIAANRNSGANKCLCIVVKIVARKVQHGKLGQHLQPFHKLCCGVLTIQSAGNNVSGRVKIKGHAASNMRAGGWGQVPWVIRVITCSSCSYHQPVFQTKRKRVKGQNRNACARHRTHTWLPHAGQATEGLQ